MTRQTCSRGAAANAWIPRFWLIFPILADSMHGLLDWDSWIVYIGFMMITVMFFANNTRDAHCISCRAGESPCLREGMKP